MRIHTRGLPITQSMAVVLLPARGPLLFLPFSNDICKGVGRTLFPSPLQGLAKPREEIKPENHLRKSPGLD